MKPKYLNAPGKGKYTYDYSNDILLFKVKDREYLKSIEFENLVVDIDKEGFITGMRIFDASKVFRLPKLALNNVKQFEFNANVESGVVSIQLRFTAMIRNKPLVQGQDFVREALNSKIEDSSVVCSVA